MAKKKIKTKAYLESAAASANAYANGAKGGPLGMIGTALAGIVRAVAQNQANTQAQTPTAPTTTSPVAPTTPVTPTPVTPTPVTPVESTYQPTYVPITPTVIDPYSESQEVIDARERFNKYLNGEGKPTYTSKYNDTIAKLADEIANRKDFSYDFNADPLYQNYKDQYTRQATLANQNAVGQAAALTGGYGNSYATTAGALAYQDQMSKLNDVIPQLYEAAYNKYQNDIAGRRADLTMYQGLEDTDYGRYRDSMADYNADRDFYGNDYYNKSNMDYSRYRDKVGDAQWNDSFRQSENQYGYGYNSDQYWNNKNFDYQKSVDDRNFNYQKEQDDRNFNYQKEQDEYQRFINDRDFNYNRELDDRNYAYQLERDAVADKQQRFDNRMTKKEFNLNKKIQNYNMSLKGKASGSSGGSGGGYRSSGSRSSGSGITSNQRGVYNSIYKYKDGNSAQSKVAWNSLNGTLKDRYNLTPDQIDYLYYDYLGYKGGTKPQALEATASDNARVTSASEKKYQTLDDVPKKYRSGILSYVDFVRNMPSDASLRQYKSYPDYLEAMVNKNKKK